MGLLEPWSGRGKRERWRNGFALDEKADANVRFLNLGLNPANLVPGFPFRYHLRAVPRDLAVLALGMRRARVSGAELGELAF